MSDNSANKVGLTARDMTLLTMAFQCSKDPNGLQVDYEKFADKGGFKTKNSACTSWLNLKKKIASNGNTTDAGTNTKDGAAHTKAKTTPKNLTSKVKNETDADASADDEGTPTPSPKGKAGVKRKAAGVENANDGADAANGIEASDETPSKKKRAARKPKDPNATPTKRAKKGTKATATAPTEHEFIEDPNTQLASEAHASIFGNGIKNEELDDQDALHSAGVANHEVEEAADDMLFGGDWATA